MWNLHFNNRVLQNREMIIIKETDASYEQSKLLETCSAFRWTELQLNEKGKKRDADSQKNIQSTTSQNKCHITKYFEKITNLTY